jgi:hypothetical protein
VQPLVFKARHGIQVIQPDAPLVAAQVVNLLIVKDVPNLGRVGEAMG